MINQQIDSIFCEIINVEGEYVDIKDIFSKLEDIVPKNEDTILCISQNLDLLHTRNPMLYLKIMDHVITKNYYHLETIFFKNAVDKIQINTIESEMEKNLVQNIGKIVINCKLFDSIDITDSHKFILQQDFTKLLPYNLFQLTDCINLMHVVYEKYVDLLYIKNSNLDENRTMSLIKGLMNIYKDLHLLINRLHDEISTHLVIFAIENLSYSTSNVEIFLPTMPLIKDYEYDEQLFDYYNILLLPYINVEISNENTVSILNEGLGTFTDGKLVLEYHEESIKEINLSNIPVGDNEIIYLDDICPLLSKFNPNEEILLKITCHKFNKKYTFVFSFKTGKMLEVYNKKVITMVDIRNTGDKCVFNIGNDINNYTNYAQIEKLDDLIYQLKQFKDFEQYGNELESAKNSRDSSKINSILCTIKNKVTDPQILSLACQVISLLTGNGSS